MVCRHGIAGALGFDAGDLQDIVEWVAAGATYNERCQGVQRSARPSSLMRWLPSTMSTSTERSAPHWRG